MAANGNGQCYDSADEDYIDMEVSSFTSFFSNSFASTPNPREFEFQMSACSQERDYSTTSPADELFYKGKLLPLHLPPRLEMVEKLLQNSNSYHENRKAIFDEFYNATPPMTTAVTTPTATSTPFESCTVSPSESCQVSKELNPEEYFLEYSAGLGDFNDENRKKSWTKKLRLIKQTSFGSKLKASKAYIRSFFGKSGCSDESCTSASRVADEGSVSKAKLNNFVKPVNKTPFGEIRKNRHHVMQNAVTRNINNESTNEVGCHRRSFSMSITRQPGKKPPSSSSASSTTSAASRSSGSKGFHPLQYLKRSSSTNSDVENSIQGAIAHCKQSQQTTRSRKTVSEVGFYPLSASRISACDDQERLGLCRG